MVQREVVPTAMYMHSPLTPFRASSSMAMAKLSRRGPPWTPTAIWCTILASVAVNLLSVSLHVPLYKNELWGRSDAKPNSNIFDTTTMTKISAENNVEKMAAAAVQEIDVSATSGSRPVSKDAVINLDHGDPTMFEEFWRSVGDRGTIVISGWQTMSYFSDPTSVCWFLEPDFAREIRRLHGLVGNAVTDGRHIVVGTGSTQLFQAAIYALSSLDAPEPMSVVSAAPYYSSFPMKTDFLRSRLFQWAGDARSFAGDSYIEVVCSPNNPDGLKNEAVLRSKAGKTVHDLAYYWPQYTAITGPADHDVALFTVSKSTGHAGTRLGWALVKDPEVAKKMTKFMELNTIGVSKDSQLRAAKILKVISDGYEAPGSEPEPALKLFDFGRRKLAARWEKLREVVAATGIFSLPEYASETCAFTGETVTSFPAFAWLKCEKHDVEDCAGLLKSHKILTRHGKYFGSGDRYTRVSMLDRDETFDLFIQRLASIN